MIKLSEHRNQHWYVDINKVRTDYVIIENLKQFMADAPPHAHPDHPIYINFWSRETKKCIEGVWGKEFGKYRYMPGNLYFFGNYGVIEHSWEDERGVVVTEDIKPKIVDYIWDFAYSSMVCYGFSGFEKDDEFSCNYKLKQFYEGSREKKKLPKACLNKNGEPKIYKEPYEYIRGLHDKKLGKPLFSNPTLNMNVLGSRGGCHRKGTKIRMYDGSLKNVEDILVGDQLMGVDSKPRNVLNLGRGFDKFFKVDQLHGDTYYVNQEHIIACYKKGSFKNKRKSPIEFKTAKEIFEYQEKYGKDPQRGYVGFAECNIEYPEKDLTYDPYWLGLWLGDGFKREKMICVAKHETEILDWLINYANSNGWDYSIKTSKSGLVNSETYRFTLKRGGDESTKKSWFGKTIRNNKHIPDEYMINSRENRLKLLAGMIDSDGSYDTNRYTITNTDLKLLRQFQILAKSLGFKAVINKPNRTGITNSLKYNLKIYGNLQEIPCLVKRKIAVTNSGGFYGYGEPTKRAKGSNYNTLTLTPLEGEEFFGFELDGDHLYLLEDYTVTHNTKSYWVAIAELEYNFVFGSARRYDQKFIDGEYKCAQCVGAGDTNKSSELLNKLLASQAAKADGEMQKFKDWFGIWTEVDSKGDLQVYPCPFHKKTLGNLDCPNKKPNKIFRAKYKVEINGRWEERGTGSTIAHVNYSTKKGDGFRAAEGGRYVFTDVEEVGSLENYIEVLGANEGTTSRGGRKIGVQWAQGTSGHIEYIQAAKKVFLRPDDYECLEFQTVFNKTPTGYFLPYYITLFSFKDENGNTDYEGAINYVNEQRIALSKSNDPKPLRDFMMNKPCYIPEMWVTDQGFYLPYEEASAREKELMEYDLYQSLMTNVELYYDESGPYNGINYKILHDAEPYVSFPHDHGKKSDPSGCVVIYEWPEPDAPSDMYMFVGHDPYVEEDIDRGGSVGSTHIIKNPKYITQGYTGNVLVATYIGKPTKGLDYYYGQQERLLQMYANPERGLWFEKNRGDACREYYIRKHKVNLLALTPQRTQGSSVMQKNIVSYGYVVGNKVAKIQQAKMLNDWLLEETEFNVNGVVEKKRNIARIPCIYTIRQIMQYNIDDNFDAVDSLRGAIIGIREYENTLTEYMRKKQQENVFKNLLNNNRIFSNGKGKNISRYSSKGLRER